MTRRRIPEPRDVGPWLPLSTERLVLRAFREDDLGDAHAYGSDPEVTRFMLWGPNTIEDSRAFLERKLAEQAVWPRPSVNAAVELAAEGRVIGAIELRAFGSAERTGEIGYSFARAFWGHGYACEAAAAMIAQGFGRLRLRRIVATCDVRNRGSWRVMEKLGMRREGCFKKDVKVRRGWRDSYLYALLAEEWRKGRAGS
jgi:RimJ/RimL family protein N-acetyltransferase